MVELHLPKPHALHTSHLREPGLRVEFLCRTVPRRSDWYIWERAKASDTFLVCFRKDEYKRSRDTFHGGLLRNLNITNCSY